MSRYRGEDRPATGRFPRVSGDEPGGLEIDGIQGTFYPRERG